MALDMYLQTDSLSKQDKFDHHEELLFKVIESDSKYSTMNLLWENFYKSPKTHPDMADKLIHELLLLKDSNRQHTQFKLIATTVDRLILFFNLAWVEQSTITTDSD